MSVERNLAPDHPVRRFLDPHLHPNMLPEIRFSVLAPEAFLPFRDPLPDRVVRKMPRKYCRNHVVRNIDFRNLLFFSRSAATRENGENRVLLKSRHVTVDTISWRGRQRPVHSRWFDRPQRVNIFDKRSCKSNQHPPRSLCLSPPA